jgi:ribonucleoside-diphosphate reductase alpha chain
MLVTAGGKAPGPEPLKDCLHNIQKILDRKSNGEQLLPIEVHDIFCYIADAVLSGGIRRSAMIALFDLDDDDMLTCKFGNWWEENPQRGRANNSAVIVRHKIEKNVFLNLWKKIELSNSGEPGFMFTNDPNWGLNPCAEISLRPFQFCNLCEINVSDLVDQDDFNARAKAAAFIGTLQASYTDFHYLRDVWKRTTEKEALIGIGKTGIASTAVLKLNMKEAANVVKAENERVAELIGINKAARTTTVKPSGCVTPETEIMTTSGPVSLQSLFDSAGIDPATVEEKTFIPFDSEVTVLDENNQEQKITSLYVNGVSEVLDIEMEDGLVVSVTPNHKFLTSRGWVRADELTEEDEIVSY